MRQKKEGGMKRGQERERERDGQTLERMSGWEAMRNMVDRRLNWRYARWGSDTCDGEDRKIVVEQREHDGQVGERRGYRVTRK